jgi:hypothetical protein
MRSKPGMGFKARWDVINHWSVSWSVPVLQVAQRAETGRQPRERKREEERARRKTENGTGSFSIHPKENGMGSGKWNAGKWNGVTLYSS